MVVSCLQIFDCNSVARTNKRKDEVFGCQGVGGEGNSQALHTESLDIELSFLISLDAT